MKNVKATIGIITKNNGKFAAYFKVNNLTHKLEDVDTFHKATIQANKLIISIEKLTQRKTTKTNENTNP